MSQTYTADEKVPKFKFSEFSLKSIDVLAKTYQESLDELEKIVKNPGSYIDETFGVCNNKYKMRYVTPHNISTFISYVGKVINERPFPIENVNDMELMTVAMIQRFVNDNKKCVPFEDTNAYGTNAYIDQRTINLAKLLIMCNNEFYDTAVYSKADLESRAKAMQDDIKILTDMNFYKNIKKMIEALPGILDENCPEVKCNRKTARLMEEAISRFLQTVCAINLCTVEQMMAYCVPRKTYTVKKEIKNPNKRYDFDYYDESSIEIKEHDDSEDYVLEAVDLNDVKPVFINLSEGGNNFVSKTIRNVTGEEYSHSSIGFDVELNKLYTFNGGYFNDNVYHWQKPGFQLEALRSSKYNGVRCTVYCMLVKNDTFDRMLNAAHKVEQSGAKYDYKACADRWFATSVKKEKDANPARTDNPKRQICSSLVNSLIAIAGQPLGWKEVTSPGELGKAALAKPKQFFCVYDGPGENYDPEIARQKIEDFAKRPTTEVYGESYVQESYYTECCLLKTNEMRIRSKIPFNCNMRDIVLQDMHPLFKDTESAIMFMVSDERSPITGLLRKYRTINRVQPNYRVLNMFMHLCPNNNEMNPEATKDPAYLMNKRAFMHTDPNWLDKITYGNQFLDGNYRTDAVGNNKFSPIEETLNHLYSMYCCEGLKTNEQLADHIIEVSNIMNSIIQEYRTGRDGKVYNWDMFRDILAVLGEILTRAMLKLYDNNSRVYSISDQMDDTAAPGYMYTESFDMFLEANAPSMKVDSNKTGIAKSLGKAKSLINHFIQWIQSQFMNGNKNFEKNYKEQIDYVTRDPEHINQKIKQALDNGFVVNLNNFPQFKIQVKAIQQIKLKDFVEKNIDDPTNLNVINALNAIVQDMGLKASANGAPASDQKAATKQLIERMNNFILYGQDTPVTKTGVMTSQDFEDMCQNIIHSKELMDTIIPALGKDMKEAADILKKKMDSVGSSHVQMNSFIDEIDGNVFNEVKVEVRPSAPASDPASTPASAPQQQVVQPPAPKSEVQGQGEQQPAAPAAPVNWEAVFNQFNAVINAIEMDIQKNLEVNFYQFNYKFYVQLTKDFKAQYDENIGKTANANTANNSNNADNVKQVDSNVPKNQLKS